MLSTTGWFLSWTLLPLSLIYNEIGNNSLTIKDQTLWHQTTEHHKLTALYYLPIKIGCKPLAPGTGVFNHWMLALCQPCLGCHSSFGYTYNAIWFWSRFMLFRPFSCIPGHDNICSSDIMVAPQYLIWKAIRLKGKISQYRIVLASPYLNLLAVNKEKWTFVYRKAVCLTYQIQVSDRKCLVPTFLSSTSWQVQLFSPSYCKTWRLSFHFSDSHIGSVLGS